MSTDTTVKKNTGVNSVIEQIRARTLAQNRLIIGAPKDARLRKSLE